MNTTENTTMTTKTDEQTIAEAMRLAEQEREDGKTGACSLCDKGYTNWGNNPYPLCPKEDHEARCCDGCNATKVIPARITEHFKQEVLRKRLAHARKVRQFQQGRR